MREKLVLVTVLALFGGFGALHALRSSPEASPAAETSRAEKAAEEPGAQTPAEATPTDAGKVTGAALAEAAEVRAMDRPLAIVGLGYELVAPGIVANGGAEPSEEGLFADAGFQTRISAVASMADVEAALARGGADAERGADVAVVPLPSFVASYERLRALEPEIFFVVGRSVGREVVMAKDVSALSKTRRRTPVKLAGELGEPETFVALFALDLVGVPPTDVELVSQSATASALIVAVDHKAARKHSRLDALLTSADMPSLVPFVAIAPRGFVAQHRAVLADWSKAWLAGTTQMRSDVPAAARLVASVKGAPEAVTLLEELGRIDLATVAENARYAGLSGRDPLTLQHLFERTWALWRNAGALTTPRPDRVPMTTAVLQDLVFQEGAVQTSAQSSPPVPAEPERVLLTIRAPRGKLDEAAVIRDAAFTASVFERSPVRVTVKRSAKRTQRVVAGVVERYGVDPDRVLAGSERARAPALIQVLAAE